jgi:hypothetical protein
MESIRDIKFTQEELAAILTLVDSRIETLEDKLFEDKLSERRREWFEKSLITLNSIKEKVLK